MITELEKNINTEIQILREISKLVSQRELSSQGEREFVEQAILSLSQSMQLINKSIPEMIKDISLAQKLPTASRSRNVSRLENVEYAREGKRVQVVLNSSDKARFLKELDISETFLKKIRSVRKEKERRREFQGSRGYVKYANRFFLPYASALVDRGKFKNLALELQRANIAILFRAYVAVLFFSTLLSFIVSLGAMIFLLFFEVGFVWPFFSAYDGSFFSRLASVFWIPIAVPIITFGALYFYPGSEKKALRKMIDQELPFAVIHMSAISGSGIEPSEIFKIIGTSNDYPHLKKELRKVLNQINLYGYDLVSALNNAAKTSPSEHLAELFSGLSTTITSGSAISDFLEKRAEGLLLNYRLEREKYTKLVETFLDIYISIVVAAPMIFLLLLILMSVSGISVGFSSVQLSVIAVVGIALLNVFFIIFLHVKQPSY